MYPLPPPKSQQQQQQQQHDQQRHRPEQERLERRLNVQQLLEEEPFQLEEQLEEQLGAVGRAVGGEEQVDAAEPRATPEGLLRLHQDRSQPLDQQSGRQAPVTGMKRLYVSNRGRHEPEKQDGPEQKRPRTESAGSGATDQLSR